MITELPASVLKQNLEANISSMKKVYQIIEDILITFRI